MQLGPVELLVLEFPSNDFTGEIGAALEKLVQGGTIRIVDLVFVSRDASGVVHSRELTEVDSDDLRVWDPLVSGGLGLLSRDDIQRIGESLAPGTSSAALLFEHTWATELTEALARARGRLVKSERVPKAAIDQLVAASDGGRRTASLLGTG
jgi:uncharacterized membrane protein